MMFGNLFVNIINGSGQLKVQTIASLFSPFVFLAVCYVLIKQQIGVQAVLIAAIISNFNGLILAPLQCYYLVKPTKE
jgi:Na+-driven multidrug efflux pump